MNTYDITFSCLGHKRTWVLDGSSEEEARRKLLNSLWFSTGLKPENVIVHDIEKRQSWICAAWNRVLQSFCK